MRQLFLRLYVSMLVVLFVAWLIYSQVYRVRAIADRNRVVFMAHGGGARVIAQEIAETPVDLRPARMQEIQSTFKYPVRLLDRKAAESIEGYIERRADNLAIVNLPGERFEMLAYVPNSTDAIRMGPFPDYTGKAIEDSLSGWVQITKQILDASPDFDESLAQLQSLFAIDIRVVSSDELTERQRDYLANENSIILFPLRDGQWYAGTLLQSGDRLLRFGPFPGFERLDPTVAATTLALVLLPVAVAIAMLLRPVSRQLRQVEVAATEIAKGNLQARVNVQRIGPARTMAQAFNNMAERTEKMVRGQRDLLQAVSHELRTPLARIRFSIDLIASAKSDAERHQRLNALESASDELNELVGELIQYVRMDTADVPSQRELISVIDAVQHLLPKYESLYPEKRFVIQTKDNQETIQISADRVAFHRAIGNLLSNAGRHATKQIVIGVANDDKVVLVTVSDDGPGVPAAEAERIFEPFVRLDNQTSESHPGANLDNGVGLGLALVKRIVDTHGGTIQVSPGPMGGCCFRTSWPMAVDTSPANMG